MAVSTEVRLLNQKGGHWFKTLLDHGRNWEDIQKGSRAWKGLTFLSFCFPKRMENFEILKVERKEAGRKRETEDVAEIGENIKTSTIQTR